MLPSCVTLGSVLHQTSSVRLWWPNGHGAQPGYCLTVTGFQGGSLTLKTETKVRETALQKMVTFILMLLVGSGAALLVDQ